MQREFLPFPSILLQSPPFANGPNDGLVIQVMISWPPEPLVPKPPDVPFASKDIIWLRIMHPPFPLVPPGPPCPGRLLLGSTGLDCLDVSPRLISLRRLQITSSCSSPSLLKLVFRSPGTRGMQPSGQASNYFWCSPFLSLCGSFAATVYQL